MRPAAGVQAFLADPVGKYVAGAAFVAWMQTPSRVGASHFGVFDTADRAALEALFALPVNPALVAPFDVMHDTSAIEVFDRAAFEMLQAFLSQRLKDVLRGARRFALVRPRHFAGATYTGLYHDWIPDGTEASLFDSREDALDWLDVPAGSADRAELEELWATFDGPAPLLRKARAEIANDLLGATLERVASRLGHSARSLQRHLAGAGSTFREELDRARIAAARARLVESDDKIAAIASALGFKSLAGFTTMFRRATGEAPSAFRQRHR